DWKAVVEPDYCRGSGPHEITNDAVIAVCNPAILGERLRRERAKLLRWPRDPVRLPMKGIELDVRKIHPACERLGKRGLADATGANHNNTRHLAHAIELLRHR